MAQHIGVPIYIKIALDLAGRICNGEIKEGRRIFGRSTLAGEYNVSPETIRRAVSLLEDMGVVVSSHGSGIYVNSVSGAYSFIEKYQNKESIRTLKNEMKELMNKKHAIEQEISEKIEKIIDYSDRLKNINALTPLEIDIEEGSHLIGKTIKESMFWQNTGATIIAIKRHGTIILSPGPYGGFEKEDSIFVVGDSNTLARVREFMK